MSTGREDLDQTVDDAERIGVIGSPSSTSALSLDILASAVSRRLVGELALLRYLQDATTNYALGQITEVSLRNVWHEDPTMRSLIRQRGRVDAVSERQDTHLGDMTVSAVFSCAATGYRPSILGTVPATGTPIHLVNDTVLQQLLSGYQEQLFYLGRVYGSTPLLPLWFKHFGTGPHGAGEAYHLGIFGKTGSGKSVLAKMILLAYGRHRDMGLFVLDPQGEFAAGLGPAGDEASMATVLCPRTLGALGRPFEVYDLSRLRLDTWAVFNELLVDFGFLKVLGVKYSNYQADLADYVVDGLQAGEVRLRDLETQEAYLLALSQVDENVHRVYAGKAGQGRVKDFVEEARSADNLETSPAWRRWQSAARLFARRPGAESTEAIVRRALETGGARSIIVVDLSKVPDDASRTVWDDKIKPLLVDRFLNVLVRRAEQAYQVGTSLNTLVVVDEAHRLAPEGRVDNERLLRVRQRLVDAVRTTRKYGLGWMFLSLTLASLEREIRHQLRIFFFGFGLGAGNELRALRELAGGRGKALDLYQLFRDPHSSFDMASREYSFMTTGPVSPLSFAGTPLFFNAFTDLDEFLEHNGLAGTSGSEQGPC